MNPSLSCFKKIILIGGVIMICCFFGHRKIDKTPELINKLRENIEALILNENVDTFLFGCNSQFDDMCYEIVSELKEKYSDIKRVYVRAKFPYIDESYEKHLLAQFEESYYPDCVMNSGKAAYVKRNYEMIDKSDICLIYYDENYLPPTRKRSNKYATNYQPKSGTRIAFEYAIKKKRKIINVIDIIK